MSSLSTRALRRAAFLALLPAVLAAQAGSGTVAGRVTANGEGIGGAAVVATGTGRGVQTRTDGTYRLSLPAGRYEIRIRAVGFSSGRDSVTVTSTGTTSLDFSLTRRVATLEAVSTLGTRGEARTVIDAPVPIDVLSSAEIKATGRTETAQMIQALAPSFNFPRTSIGDGTDHVRPATLRGLAPDQALVLVNGKRRHQSALVNANGFVGRGSSAVDLNAIPSSMIDHIEILRDGAAAQYGSDAIAGVLNIVLKKDAGGEIRTTVGGSFTTYNRDDGSRQLPGQLGSVSARDGKVFQVAMDYGWTFGSNGYMHVAGELRDRGQTNRSLLDLRQQYFAGDPREANQANPPPDGRRNHRQGDGSTHDLQGFWNGATTLANGIELYTFGGVSDRGGEATGFWRRPNDDRTLRNIFPDGFLPIIRSDIVDASAAVGARGAAKGWRYDLSGNYGGDRFGFTIKNSANVSLGPTSKTVFDAGALQFKQATANFDLFREFRDVIPVPLRVALGAEARNDNYAIVAGEFDSWRNGGFRVIGQNNVVTTRPAAPGSQVFPGFKGDSAGKKGDAGVHSRSNVAGYIDLESDITSALLLGIAGRVENYSDFGSTADGKLSARLQVIRGLALRGAASTGFRAPSLMQQYFSSTATNFVAGVPFDIRTFPVNTPEAKALGARDLTAEQSTNFSGGVAWEPVTSFSVTADYYFVGIDDRIIFSENFTGAAVTAKLVQLGVIGVQGGRYFTNAIDTKTRGLDVIANYGMTFGNGGVWRLTGAYNQNRTSVERVSPLPADLASLSEQLFGRVERARIEKGNPRNNLILTSNYNLKRANLLLRTQRFGEVTTFGTAATNAFGPLDQTFSAKWITDISAGYDFGRFAATIGSDNVLDVYPDRNSNPGSIAANNGGNANFGIFPYAGVSPFGFNGRFIYARLSAGL